MDNLDSITEHLRTALSAKDEAREKALPLCRETIRYCSNAIRAVHRQEIDQAIELLKTARKLLTEAEQVIAAHDELINVGLIRDAQKELAEGNITLALVTGQSLPEPDELGVDAAAYLNGLGEAVGEIRRYLLDSLRKGDLSRGEELLSAMDDIYSVLVTMDFPDAVTGGLRRTTDMVRGVLERTRSDLTLTIRQKDLEIKLEDFQEEEIQISPLREPSLDDYELELFEALCNWRAKKSSEENLAPFIIARDSWLKQIIRLNPATQRNFSGIIGFGERRANKYGKEIIDILKKGHK
ncbi:HRDC domain-containing protein [Chloroflexota bacterium]